MREHDYLMQTSYPYRAAKASQVRGWKSALYYSRNWLSLRRMMREFFRANPNIQVSQEIKDAIGMRS
jgi:hypothetical protein